jgi:hypothetical protein
MCPYVPMLLCGEEFALGFNIHIQLERKILKWY